jgi:hypothetical protein
MNPSGWGSFYRRPGPSAAEPDGSIGPALRLAIGIPWLVIYYVYICVCVIHHK